MIGLTSLFIRANGAITAHPTAEEYHLDEIDDPVSFFQERLDSSLSHYDHIACDVTDNCNLRCPFCINDFSNASSARMHAEHFEKFLQIAPLAKGENVFISCLCEPLLHPQLLDLLEMIPNTLRNKLFLTTNLSTKRLDKSFFIRLAGVALHHINISVDSLEKQTFERMRVNAKFTVFKHNLEKAAKSFAERADSPEFRFITVAARSNLSEIPSLIKAAREQYQVDWHEVRYPFEEGTPEGKWKEENVLTADEWNDLVARLTDLPYWTTVTRGSSVLRCGFGRMESVSQTWGPRDAVTDNVVPPWYLPLLIRLYPAWRSLRSVVSQRLRLQYSGPAIDVALATASNDVMVRMPKDQGIGAFAITGVNHGGTALVTLLPMIPKGCGMVATICPTDPKDGSCVEAAKPTLRVKFEHGSISTFTVFVRRWGRGTSRLPITRVEVLFLDEMDRLCGVTHVFVQAK